MSKNSKIMHVPTYLAFSVEITLQIFFGSCIIEYIFLMDNESSFFHDFADSYNVDNYIDPECLQSLSNKIHSGAYNMHESNNKEEREIITFPTVRSSDQNESMEIRYHLFEECDPIQSLTPERSNTKIQSRYGLQQNNAICKKGERFQTLNLGKHLKTELMNFFRVLSFTNLLTKEEITCIETYKKTNGSLNACSELFEVTSLRKKCEEFLTSKNFIENILQSTKMTSKIKQ